LGIVQGEPSGFAVRPVEAPEDADQTTFQWQTCSPQLCEALLSLDPDALETFKGHGALLAGYRPGPAADPLVFRIGIAGLAEGLAGLRP